MISRSVMAKSGTAKADALFSTVSRDSTIWVVLVPISSPTDNSARSI